MRAIWSRRGGGDEIGSCRAEADDDDSAGGHGPAGTESDEVTEESTEEVGARKRSRSAA